MLTESNDTEIYLLNFFDLNSLYNYARISKSFNIFINKLELYNNLMHLQKILKSDQIQKIYLADWASNNGYIKILDWWKITMQCYSQYSQHLHYPYYLHYSCYSHYSPYTQKYICTNSKLDME